MSIPTCPKRRGPRCSPGPRCGGLPVAYQQLWSASPTHLAARRDGSPIGFTVLPRAYGSAVRAQCGTCKSWWRLRGVSRVDELHGGGTRDGE